MTCDIDPRDPGKFWNSWWSDLVFMITVSVMMSLVVTDKYRTRIYSAFIPSKLVKISKSHDVRESDVNISGSDPFFFLIQSQLNCNWLCPTSHPFTKICGNPFHNFCVILLRNKQTGEFPLPSRDASGVSAHLLSDRSPCSCRFLTAFNRRSSKTYCSLDVVLLNVGLKLSRYP